MYLRDTKMVSFKIVLVFLVYFFTESVICGRQNLRTLSAENENLPSVHNIKTRSAFVTPIKHVIGHIADHLGIHSRHRGCEDRHFHHHHGFSMGHLDNNHPGYNFHKDFSVIHDPNVYHGPPSFPEENKQHDFHHHGPVRDPQFHPHFPINNNNDFHAFHKDKPDRKHEFPEEKDERPPIEVDKKVDEKKTIHPPQNQGGNSKNDEDYPVSDFEKNDKKIGKNPFVNEGGSVDLESDFSGENNEKKVEDNSRDWVIEPEDEVENTGSGEIPSTSQIDIRFRKN